MQIRYLNGGKDMKQIKLRIYPTGKLEAETNGIKGKACLDYISILEKLTASTTVDSDFTAEYWETEDREQILSVTEVNA